MENATSFGSQADIYASARPNYPDTLFDWISANAPALEQVWDVGSGTGQAARSLAKTFKHVHATDIDAAQIAQARKHPTHTPNVSYAARSAHISGLPDKSTDAITVATALHWFDVSKFWDEVQRVAKPNALFCAWTYHRIDTNDEVKHALITPILEIIDPYWSEGNRLSWRGYPIDEVGMPFAPIETPGFSIGLTWSPAQLLGFMTSWSAHKRARSDGQAAHLETVQKTALDKLGGAPLNITLPLHTLAGRVK